MRLAQVVSRSEANVESRRCRSVPGTFLRAGSVGECFQNAAETDLGSPTSVRSGLPRAYMRPKRPRNAPRMLLE
jgi:hypothetical protein